MRTIRKNVFETNSSSCHSISMTTTPRKIIEFNDGLRYYFSGLWVGGTKENNYTPDIRIEEGLYTLEELYGFFCQLINYDRLSSYKGENIDDPLLQVDSPIPLSYKFIDDKEYKEDFEQLKTFIIDNNSFELFQFAFTGKGKNIFCSKLILRSFILGAFYSYHYSGLIMTKNELLNTRITFNYTEYGESNSPAKWGIAASDNSKIIVNTVCPDDSDIDTEYLFEADIRDN